MFTPIREKQEEKSNNKKNPSFEQKSVYPKKGKPRMKVSVMNFEL